MGDHYQAPGELLQVALQPKDHVAVQVVGGLVQDEDVCRVQEDGRQGHTLPLAAGEGPYSLVKVGDPQAGEHGLGLVLHEGAHIGGEVGKDLLQNGVVLVHLGVLA